MLERIKHWDAALLGLTEDSRKIVPVKKRVNPLTEPLPVRALCNYATDEVPAGVNLNIPAFTPTYNHNTCIYMYALYALDNYVCSL